MHKTVRGRFLIVAALGVVLLAGAAYLYLRGDEGAGIPCPTFYLTGLYCAGCGSSRALQSILHLELYQAFRYNPVMVLLLPFIAAYFCAVAVSYVKHGRNTVDAKLPFRIVFVIVVIVLVYSVARNIPVFPFTWLRPTVVS